MQSVAISRMMVMKRTAIEIAGLIHNVPVAFNAVVKVNIAIPDRRAAYTFLK